MVLDAIVAKKDLMEACERNQLKKIEGNEIKSKLEEVKTVKSMFHFNHLGSKIGQGALQKKKELI